MLRRLSLLLIAVFMLTLLAPSPDPQTQGWPSRATHRAAARQATHTAIWAEARARSKAIWSQHNARVAAIRTRIAASTPAPTPTPLPGATRLPAWQPSPSPTPQWVQMAQQASGTWVFQGKRMQIEVLSHQLDHQLPSWQNPEPGLTEEERQKYSIPPRDARNGYQYLRVTIRLHNPQLALLYPDISSLSLRGDGTVFHQTSPRNRCGHYPNKLQKIITAQFGDPQLPGKATITGDICFQVPTGLQNLELVPHTHWNWDGPAIRVHPR